MEHNAAFPIFQKISQKYAIFTPFGRMRSHFEATKVMMNRFVNKALEVVSKAHLTLTKVHPPQAGGQVAVLWPFLVNVRGPLPLTLNTYAHVYCVFSSIHALHLGVI